MADYFPKQASEIRQEYNKYSGLSKDYKVESPLEKYQIETYSPRNPMYQMYQPKRFY